MPDPPCVTLQAWPSRPDHGLTLHAWSSRPDPPVLILQAVNVTFFKFGNEALGRISPDFTGFHRISERIITRKYFGANEKLRTIIYRKQSITKKISKTTCFSRMVVEVSLSQCAQIWSTICRFEASAKTPADNQITKCARAYKRSVVVWTASFAKAPANARTSITRRTACK